MDLYVAFIKLQAITHKRVIYIHLWLTSIFINTIIVCYKSPTKVEPDVTQT